MQPALRTSCSLLTKVSAVIACSLCLLPPGQVAWAADRIKQNNVTNLNVSGSWSGGVPDLGNMAVWDNTVTADNSVLLGGDVTWQGIRIANPGGKVTIGAGNTLNLSAGQAGISIDMSSATQDLTIQSGLTLRAAVGQLWSIASGRTLTLDTGLFTRRAGATLNVQGPGTVTTTNIFNDYTGLMGSWAVYGTGTTAYYARVDDFGNIVAYTTAEAAATAAGVSDTTGALSYDVAAVGAFGLGTSFNTLRYTGAAGTMTGAFTANGILTAGSGALTISGNITVGGNQELVLFNGDNSTNRNIIISGTIADGRVASAVTKGGTGTVTLSGNNTYTGITSISRGKLIISNANALGSTAGGTRIGISGTLSLAGGVTSAESIWLDDLTNAFNSGLMIENSGTNTLTGAIRLSGGVRWQGSNTINVTGGISTTNGNNGTSFVVQAGTLMNITGKPMSLGGNGTLYMDNNGKTIMLGVAGSTYGTHQLYAGTLQTGAVNVLSRTANINFSVAYNGNQAMLDLNGFDQAVGAISTNIYSVNGNYDRVITSASAATLTTGLNNASTTYDGRLAGAVSLTKVGTGTLTLSGVSTTTGAIAVNGGVLNVNFGRATASQTGAGALSNYLPATTPVTLGGGTFQLTGRNNGTATSLANGSWTAGQPLITVTSTAGLAPGQLVSHANLPAGAYVVSVQSSTTFVINLAPTVAGSAATITATTNSFTTSQTLPGLTLNAGGSAVTVSIPTSGSDGTVLNLGAITVNPGASVNFTLPSGTQSATNGITTSMTNTNGILGAWARVGNDWATNSTNAAGGNIIAYTGYTSVNRLGATLLSAATSNVRIVSGGTGGSLTPAASGTTDINTLLQASTSSSAATYDPGTTDVLRLGPAGGIMIASNADALNIGASANDGVLTAGGAADTAGTVYLINNHASNLLTINSTIANNGAGTVAVTTSGTGITLLTGTNTYTGRTTVGAGTLRISSEQNLGANPSTATADQLTLSGGTLNTTATFSIDDTNRGITLGAAGGSISVNASTTLTIANTIAGTGNLTVSGTGTLALTAANTWTGTTFANTGTLALGHINALQNSTLTTATAGEVTFTVVGTNTYNIGGLAGNDTVALGANTIRVGSNNETSIFTGNLTGTGGLIKVGVGTLNLNTANTFSGDTRVEAGMIVLADVNALQNSTLDTGNAGTQSFNLTLGEGTTYNIGGLKGSANFDLAVANLSVGSNNQSTTFSGVLQGAFSNNLTKVGTGTLTLLGNNTYIGTTTVSAGRLVLGGTNLSTITVAAGANLGGEGTTAGNLIFAGTTHTLDIDATTAAALGTTGAGSINVSALNAGGFVINVSGVAAGPITVFNYGSGGFSGSINKFTLGSSTASARGAGGFADNGMGAITLDLGYVVNTWVGGDSGGATLWDVGTTANWSNSKDTLFQNGDAVVFADGALNYTPTLQADVNVDTATFTNSTGNDYTLSAAAGQKLTTARGIFFTGSGNVTVSSGIAGTAALTQSGSGTTTLVGANTYTGGTFITGGTLRISDEASLGTAPGVFTAGQLTLNGASAVLSASASFAINDATRGITLGSSGGGFSADSGVVLTLANVITGSGGLTKAGAGTVTLTAANTYTGLTTVNAGTLELNNATGGNAIAGDGVAGTDDVRVNTGATLKLAAADQIANDAVVNLNGGTWDLNGKNETIRSLTGTAVATFPTLTLGGATLTLNRIDWDNTGTATSRSFSGTGTLRFVADGATQAVFEANHQGTFTVSPAVQIDASTLSFRSSTYGTVLSGKVSGTGAVVFDPTGGAGGLTLTNSANDYSGGTFWSSDGGAAGIWDLFTVSASGSLGTGTVTLQGGNQSTWTSGSNVPTAFIFNGGTTTYANNFVLTGSSTISSSSPVGSSTTGDKVTLTGTFTLGANTLYVRGTGTGTISGVISGTGGVTKIDTPSTWTLSGNNTYTGVTTVSAGALQVGSAGVGRTGTGNVTVQSGATLFGTGTVQGTSFTAQSGSTLQAGDATTTASFGTLNFTPVVGGGTQSLQGTIILGIGTANNQGVVDSTFGGNAIGSLGYINYVNNTARSTGLGTGSHDLLSFNATADSGSQTLLLSGTVQVVGSGFTAQFGQVFNLIDWHSSLTTDFSGFDVGTNFRDGSGDDLTQFNLPTLTGGLLWDVSQFTTSGIIIVVPEPSRALLLLLGVVGLWLPRRRRSY